MTKLKKIFRNKSIMFASVVLLLMICLAIFAPMLTPYSYDTIALGEKTMAPCAQHIMGTDEFGRDVWTRIIYGARISLVVSAVAVLIGLAAGSLLGLIGGFFKGAVDFVLGRLMDIFMSFPALLLSLIIGVALGASVPSMCLSIGVPLIPIFYRVTRGATMNVGERTFVTAARSMGSGNFRIMFKHILPNALPQIFVILSSSIGGSILAESSLGYLGLGIPRPIPSWGMVISEGKDFIFNAPWITGFAGLAIALTILTFNLLGDGIRDYLDPKLKA